MSPESEIDAVTPPVEPANPTDDAPAVEAASALDEPPSEPRDVLMFGWEFPPHVTGGVGVACYGLTRAMSRRGDRVLFVMPRPQTNSFGQTSANDANGGQSAAEEAAGSALDLGLPGFENVHFRGVGDASVGAYASGASPFEPPARGGQVPAIGRWAETRPADIAPDFDPSQHARDFTAGAVALAEREYAGGRKFHVVHAHDWLTFEAGRQAADKLGVPFVAHVHSTEHDRAGELADPRVMTVEGEGLRSADAVVCVSDYTADLVVERYGVDRSKIFVVHNAADADERFAPERSVRVGGADPVILFVGRLAKQKNPEGFVRAAALVLKSEPSARFVVAGAGPEADSVRRLAEKLEVADHFLFAGHLRPDDVRKLFASADLFVMPSASEPFGLVGLEAMREGVPTIISRQSGLAGAVENAIKVDFWNVEAMAEAMTKVLGDDELAERLSQRGALEVRRMRWEDAAGEVSRVYADVLTPNEPPKSAA